MSWYHVIAWFFGGAFLANATPHFIAGVSGRRFPSPFAKPPFRGLSSPLVNVLYALCNLAAAWALLALVGSFEPRRAAHFAIAAAGFGLASVNVARSLSKLRREVSATEV
ncbi:MAG: hypothetical protein IT370_14015 [Deltaproteobacteria bacterium]|nr:hypothetical protein [Deltaproteobacteria bacterium]